MLFCALNYFFCISTQKYVHIYKELKSADIIIIDKKFTRLGLTRFSCIVVVIVVEIIMSVSENIKKKEKAMKCFQFFIKFI